MNPWTLELLVARALTRELERRSLVRDTARGLLVRVRPGVYVDRVGYEELTGAGRHLVAMRALATVAPDLAITPDGPADAVIAEKRREDRVRLEVSRIGAEEGQRFDAPRIGGVWNVAPKERSLAPTLSR
jgi:hypothetical protein